MTDDTWSELRMVCYDLEIALANPEPMTRKEGRDWHLKVAHLIAKLADTLDSDVDEVQRRAGAWPIDPPPGSSVA